MNHTKPIQLTDDQIAVIEQWLHREVGIKDLAPFFKSKTCNIYSLIARYCRDTPHTTRFIRNLRLWR